MTDPSTENGSETTGRGAVAADRSQLLDAILPHVAFDGWSEASFRAAAADLGLTTAEARAIAPRGALDMAVAFHKRGDAAMLDRLDRADLAEMKIRERITFAVRARIEAIDDREAVRRGSAFFALPQNAPEGARLIWETCDAIWTALGDPSDDINWYTKRATLAGVYGSTVLFWLGDDSEGRAETWSFLDRRIEDVMRIEKVKAQVRKNPVLNGLMVGPNWLMSKVKAPQHRDASDLPGHVRGEG
ncbi:COQ9 family protein [Psychromarinibacter sp. S121]|uniref:COQ9 family protein n=1 Tax=Psychromarinibacter sp. S121 TaxID=3415127 RepID=UPI003C7E724E